MLFSLDPVQLVDSIHTRGKSNPDYDSIQTSQLVAIATIQLTLCFDQIYFSEPR